MVRVDAAALLEEANAKLLLINKVKFGEEFNSPLGVRVGLTLHLKSELKVLLVTVFLVVGVELGHLFIQGLLE